MTSESDRPPLEGWERFIGRWKTEAVHPMLPDTVVHGESTFEWLAGQQFVIQRSWHDHPQFPDGLAVFGVTDGELAMHYFDSRGVHRVYAVSLRDDVWRFWRDAPGFWQRFIGSLSDDGATITGQGSLSRDGETWQDDLAVTYRRVGT